MQYHPFSTTTGGALCDANVRGNKGRCVSRLRTFIIRFK